MHQVGHELELRRDAARSTKYKKVSVLVRQIKGKLARKQLKRWQDSFLYIWKNTLNLFLCAAMKVRECLEL